MHLSSEISFNTFLVSCLVGLGLGIGFALATGLIGLLRRPR
jgi:hypothetical protein